MPTKQRKETTSEKKSEKAPEEEPTASEEVPEPVEAPKDTENTSSPQPRGLTEVETEDLIKKVAESDLLKRQLSLMVEQMGAQIVSGLSRQIETKLSSIQAQVQKLQTTQTPSPPQSTSDMNDLRGEFHNLKQTVMETVTKIKHSPMPIPMNAPSVSSLAPRRRG